MSFFRQLPAFAGVSVFFTHRSPFMKGGTGATVKRLVVSGPGRCFLTRQNLTRTDLEQPGPVRETGFDTETSSLTTSTVPRTF